MESYDQKTETTVDIYVSTSGSACISVESFTDENLGVYDDKDVLKFTQTVLLNTEQSRTLYEQLKEHFGDATDDESDGLLDHLYDDTTLPEEPEEAGLYVSQQGHVLRKYGDTDWGYAGSNLFLYDGEKQWSNGARYTSDWDLVVKDLGEDAFPLKHIDRSYIASLARSTNEE